MNSPCDDTALPVTGFPIRKSPGQRSLSTSPKLIAASHVLHRLLAPRHPPCALNSLVTSSWVSYLFLMRAFARASEMHSPTRYVVVKDRRGSMSRVLPMQSVNRKNWHSSRSHTARNPVRCGADRVRTDDLRLAKPALSQLSYSPSRMVGLGRFELPTSRLSGVRSNHLSYRPGRALDKNSVPKIRPQNAIPQN